MPGDVFYSSRPWQRLRGMKLRATPVCEIPGCDRIAQHVDHRTSRRQAPDLELDPGNLVSLCKPHHSSKTARRDGGFGHKTKTGGDEYAGIITRGCDATGQPLDPGHHWNRKRT